MRWSMYEAAHTICSSGGGAANGALSCVSARGREAPLSSLELLWNLLWLCRSSFSVKASTFWIPAVFLGVPTGHHPAKRKICHSLSWPHLLSAYNQGTLGLQDNQTYSSRRKDWWNTSAKDCCHQKLCIRPFISYEIYHVGIVSICLV